jgi:hypothetical protein
MSSLAISSCWNLLTDTVAQIYLPPEKECTAMFMQQLLSGRKKVSLVAHLGCPSVLLLVVCSSFSIVTSSK